MAIPPPGSATAVTPPPDLPSVPNLNELLANYLRRMSLWSVAQFNNCLTKRTATGELYMQSTTGKTVWRLTIDDSGNARFTQITPGQGVGTPP